MKFVISSFLVISRLAFFFEENKKGMVMHHPSQNAKVAVPKRSFNFIGIKLSDILHLMTLHLPFGC